MGVMPESSRPDIRLHIERLVIDESLLPRGGRAALQAAVESELTRLLSEQIPMTQFSRVERNADGGTIQTDHDASAVLLGAQIAAAIQSTLKPPS